MSSGASFCMVKTPERGEQTPGEEGIGEETDIQEKDTEENEIIDLSDVASGKQNTLGKETQGNDGEDDYLPAPPEGPEQNNQNDTQEEKRRRRAKMK